MVGGSARRPRPQLPQMRISLPRHDLLGEETWPVSQRRRARSLFLKYRAYVCVYICVCVCIQIHSRAHQSLSGSNDQTIKRILRVYFESGSDS